MNDDPFQHSLHPFINVKKVTGGLAYSSEPVIELPAKSGVQRFSITVDDDPQFVTVFTACKTGRKIVQCKSSKCKMQQGHTRAVVTLRKDADICPHLSAYKQHFLNELQFELNDSESDSDPEDTDEYCPNVLPDTEVNIFFLILSHILFDLVSISKMVMF